MRDIVTIEQKTAQTTSVCSAEHFLQSSPLRANLIRWYPFREDDRVLLVSSPCEAIESYLRAVGAKVTVMSDALASDAAIFPQARYDVILHIGLPKRQQAAGTLGQDALQRENTAWAELLRRYHAMLAEGGTLLLAVPNRLGLRSFAGYRDREEDASFAGLCGAWGDASDRAQSKSEYERALDAAGFESVWRYYPYPNADLARVLYSDARLPHAAEWRSNDGLAASLNWRATQYQLFPEEKVAAGLADEGLIDSFFDEILFAARKQREDDAPERVIYMKYAAERDPRFAVRTDIVMRSDGTRVVRKTPLCREAYEHVSSFPAIREALLEEVQRRQEEPLQEPARQSRREDTRQDLTWCPVHIAGGDVPCAEFAWAKGESLQERLRGYLAEAKEREAEELIRCYIRTIEALPMDQAANVDLIFPNIIVGEDDTWQVIDYEWTFYQFIPQKWVVYRGLHYLSVELNSYAMTEEANLLAWAGITEEQAQTFAEWEARFQAYITGDTVLPAALGERYGKDVIPFAGNVSAEEAKARRLMNLHGAGAKKLYCEIERCERREGRIFLSGWACARAAKKNYFPAEIAIFDEAGNELAPPIERSMRPDVAQVLGGGSGFPYYGFSVTWSAPLGKSYTLRIRLGRQMREITLSEGQTLSFRQ